MIKQFSTKLKLQLEQEMEQMAQEIREPFIKMKAALNSVNENLKKLKVFIDEHPFSNEQDEIYFFKNIKPEFYKWLIFHAELFTIEDNLPPGKHEKQVEYLEQEFQYIERFFKQNQFQYQYYKLNAVELDNLYFIRGAKLQSVLIPDAPEVDSTFSTKCDYLFSKIRAFEMLREIILERLIYLRKTPLSIENFIYGKQAVELKWTGDTVNLAELGYGLYYTSQVNNGSAGIGEIFRWLEEKFGVSIGVPAKRMAAIRSRKRLSRTKYLDEMKEAIEKVLDKEDEFVPGRSNERHSQHFQ